MLRLLRHLTILGFGLIPLICFAQSPVEKLAPDKAPSTLDPSDRTPGYQALGEANALYRNGDFAKAAAKFKELLQDKPKSPDAWAGLIRSYLKAKNLSGAAQSAEQALSAVDHPRIHTAHAEVLFRKGEIVEAEQEWVKVANSYPDARAYLGLARVWSAYSMFGSSAGMIQKAHDLNPDDPDIRELWLTTLSQSQQVEQLKTLLAQEARLDDSQRADISRFLDSTAEWRKNHDCRLVNNVKEMEAPLSPVSPKHFQNSRGYRLSVVVNGHAEALLLDTGASGITVGRGAAQEAGIKGVISAPLRGIGGVGWTTGSVGFAESIKVGEMEFRNCPIKVSDDYSIVGEDGLVGTDVFQKFLVDIDFPDEKLKLLQLPPRPGEQNRELSLTDAPNVNLENQTSPDTAAQDRYIAPEMKSFTRVYRFGHLLLISTSIGDVPAKLFVLDTGAANNAISPAAAEEVTKLHHHSDIRVSGVGGNVGDVYTAKKAVLRFGRLRQQNQQMIAFDTTPQSDSAGTEISGFLGFGTLRMLDIKIDYRDGLVDFDYSAEKWKEAQHRHH